VLADISDHKQAEAALRQSEANYRNLLQTANSVIIRYDTQGRIHYINDYGVKLLGYEEHEIVGRTILKPSFQTSKLWTRCQTIGSDCNPQLYSTRRG